MPRHDRGSATLWGVALMGLLMTLALAFATAGSVRVARHRAHDAADLSALAAAELALVDPEGACARAATLARQNGAALSSCAITGAVADVRTSLTIPLPGLGPRTVTGRARAGPSRSSPSQTSPSQTSPSRSSPSQISPSQTSSVKST
ncbi:flp pilus-assembly TadE/G-like family protein [Nonomuraea sp. MCN248]|uniref:Flp pilus-assembly TadE/G-like family protein n=1 Tax=Nonomuraea corallina TaxID=2989783 RepID=A0ABT4SIB5_9ACTN|nr:Rv3654c family TadE-like protein [Nonomuraea corallina]MDA0636671.1 flp pilus-assembly TadE/G-like family protein [Nonomuraea corallina]